MNRFIAITTLGLAAIMTLNAGQIIALGGANGLMTAFNGTSSPVNGIPANGIVGYPLSATSSSCAGAGLSYNPGFAGCLTTTAQGVAASTTNATWTEKNYTTALFGSATLAAAQTAIPTTGPLGNINLDAASVVGNLGTIYSDFGYVNGVITPGLYTLQIPVGIKGVDTVSTLIQDFWAANNAPSIVNGTNSVNAPSSTGYSTAVQFEFNATSSDGSSGTNIFDTIYLQNGVQISSGVDCIGPTAANIANAATANNGFACGSSAAGAPDTGISGSSSSGDATITTSLAYTANYTNMAGAAGYSGTTGLLYLDEQTFDFGGKYNADFLVGLTIQNEMNPNVSKLAIGGVSVDQVTPEPSTILMFLTGLGSIGLGKLRRRK